MKKVYLVLVVGLLMILSFYIGRGVESAFSGMDEICGPVYTKDLIKVNNEKLYLKNKTWGITGNHKVTVLSINPNLDFFTDSLSQYVWKGDTEIIYRIEKDTLKLYSYQIPEIPEKNQFNVPIKFMKVENNNEWCELKRKVSFSYKMFR